MSASTAPGTGAVDAATREKLMGVFTMLDRNGSLTIDQREIGFLMNKLLNRNLDEMVLSEIMSEVCDSDAPGVGVDFESFVNALGPIIQGASEEELNKKAFSALDADGSGCISTSELAPLMSAVAGTNLPASQVSEVLALAAGADGKLRYPDFVRAVKEP